MEIWDAYNADGTLAGVDLIRGEPIQEGLFHLVCEILVRHRDGDYLLMQRAYTKEGWPGKFEATAGGSALKGEEPLTCAKRELYEETGVHADDMEQIWRYVSHKNNTIYINYLCVADCDKESVTLQDGETISYKWVTAEEFAEFVDSDEMIPSQKKRYSNYLRHEGYIQ